MDSNGNGSSCKRKNKRTCHRHTPQQIQTLEAYFKECPHPDEARRNALCVELQLEPDQVKFWFQNKRTQSKAQDERSTNIILRGENEKLQCENEAMLEALNNVICPTCGGPPFGFEERERNLQKLRFENVSLKAQRDEMAKLISNTKSNEPTMLMNPLAPNQTHQIFNPRTSYELVPRNIFDPQTFQTTMQLSDQDLMQMSETAANAVEELKRLFFAEEAFWVKSIIDGEDMINQEMYERFTHGVIRHFRSLNARVESSKEFVVVPVEAMKLIEMFLDSEKWKVFFPTIVNKAKTIHKLGSNVPGTENCNVLQLIWEQLHILSPLVQPREFMILRSCQQLAQGLWIIADVSYHMANFDIAKASCYKRPSGCLIQALPNGHTKIIWIEHVEVDDKSYTHWMYREILCSRSGYGAKRWISTLERMCERMALTSILTIPANDWTGIVRTGEGRRNVMTLGQRMLQNFNEMLTMSGKVEFPQQSGRGVRVAIRVNVESGKPIGLIVSAASSISIPLTPLQVFNALRNMDTREQWDVLSFGSVTSELSHIFTGANDTNYVSIIRPTEQETIRKLILKESAKCDILMLQDCYIDELGGMLVYAPIDMNTMNVAISGEVNPSIIPILPSGFFISNDGQRYKAAATEAEDGGGGGGGYEGGTLLTVAFQILASTGKVKTTIELKENSVDTVSVLISNTVQRIRHMLNCPQE